MSSARPTGNRDRSRRAAGWAIRILRDPAALFGILVLLLLVAAALFASTIAPLDPNKQDLGARLLPPFYAEGGSSEHILGTDQLGRDVFSRIIHGTRISLTIPLVSVTLAGIFGTAVGLLSGYSGGRADTVIMRVVDTLFSFPGLLLALTILAVVGPSFWTLAIVLSLRIWMVFARLTRGLVLSAREAEYVETAELVGASPTRIMMRHIAPNLTAPLLTLAVLESAHVILSEAALSFLGLGIQPPQTSWGLDVAIGRQYVFSAPWLIIFPGIAIAVAVLGINLLASWLRVAADPEESAKRFAAAADAPTGWSE
ncbi:MAG: ABC transporter permease [Actinomycetia bacterium]|nr:ABC transporter permease [Actinomycetes bacterium]